MKKILCSLVCLVSLTCFGQTILTADGLASFVPKATSGSLFPAIESSIGTNSLNVSSLTVLMTASGNSPFVVVFTGGFINNPATIVSGVTYGGVSMMELVSARNNFYNGNQTNKVWYLSSPPAGSQSVVVTADGSYSTLAMIAVVVTNASTVGTPALAYNPNSGGTSTSVSASATSVVNDLVLDCLSSFDSVATFTPGVGQTLVTTDGHTAGDTISSIRVSQKTATTTSTSMSWSVDSAQTFSTVAVSIH